MTKIFKKNMKDLIELLNNKELCKKVTTLDLSEANITELPKEIGELTNLTTLDLSLTKISEIPSEVFILNNLVELDLAATDLTKIPSEIKFLTSLERLDLASTKITELPQELFGLTNLKDLRISHTNITMFFSGKLLYNLEYLSLRETSIIKLPKEIGELTNLKTLDISNTNITELPKEIRSLKNLKTLNISNTNITELPKEIGELTNLENLYIFNNEIKELPKNIELLTNLKDLGLSNTNITELPKEINLKKFKKRYNLKNLFIALYENRLRLGFTNKNGDNVKKYDVSWSEYQSGIDKLTTLLKNDNDIFQLNKIIISRWPGLHNGLMPEQEIIDFFVHNRDKFLNLKSLFLGDIDRDDFDKDEINQMDYTDIWSALPNLEEITIKGTNELVLGNIFHKKLKKLTIMSAGFGANIFNELKNSILPNLESLYLNLGSEDYGLNITKKDLYNFIISLEHKKNLKKLSLTNDSYDRIMIKEADIKTFIKIVSKLPHFKSLYIKNHYIAETVQESLINECRKFKIKLTLDDYQDDYE